MIRTMRQKHLADQRPDPPGAAEERARRRAAGERAHAETLARFAPLTAENAREAIAWQAARIAELLSGASG